MLCDAAGAREPHGARRPRRELAGRQTPLIHGFVRSSFERQQKSTIGAVSHTHEQMWEGRQVILPIWDTPGQEKYSSLGPIYYRNSAAGSAEFDLTPGRHSPGSRRGSRSSGGTQAARSSSSLGTSSTSRTGAT
jgi:hypothetical protein